MEKEKGQLRITGLYAFRSHSVAPGFRPARSVGLRPRSHASLHPHLGGRSCCASPYVPAQTSHTAKRYTPFAQIVYKKSYKKDT